MPSLAAHATHTQECSVFSHYVGANFSGLWACYARRMDLNWLDFILRPAQPHPHFLQSAVRTLSILHLSQTENPSLITQSMSAYGETLASLRRAAGRLPFSDEMFAATILVALYEMKNMSFQASWVTTTNSIANVMQSTNNPSRTYASGFGRTLFLTIRPFLIRTALSRGQACFLERAEWISVVETMVHSENHNSRGSLFGATIEKAFIEIVKIPGLAARTYALHAASEDSVLTASTIQCQSRLVDIERDMRNTSLAVSGAETDTPTTKHHLGPIPLQSANSIIQHAIDGIQSALTLLGTLLQQQSAHRLARQHHLGLASAPECRVILTPAYSTVEEFYEDLGATYDALPSIGWPDFCSLTMGMVPSRDGIVFPWQCRHVMHTDYACMESH